jgi:hypothetical protein
MRACFRWVLLVGSLSVLTEAFAQSEAILRGGLELSGQGVSTGTTPTANRGFWAVAFPLVTFEPTDNAVVEVGAPFRFSVGRTSAPLLRLQDWDERSDYGQLLQQLRLGSEATAVSLEAGPTFLRTLGHGHLVRRYSNQTHADYHPSSGLLTGAAGPVRAEAFASDVLAARLFTGEVSLDLGRLLSTTPAWDDRVHVAISGAHDAGRAGGNSAPVTLGHLDVDVSFLRGGMGSATLLLGAGTRTGPVSGSGALAGLALEGRFSRVRVGMTAEVRHRGGGFKQDFFGADYELARFVARGFSGMPLALVSGPATTTGFGEVSFEWAGEVLPLASLSVAVDRLGSRSFDVDVVGSFNPVPGVTLLLRTTATGIGETSRVLCFGETRVRFLPSVYLLAQGGTQFTRAATLGGLDRAWYAGLGAGIDFAALGQ